MWMEVATLADSAEDSLEALAVVVVADPAVADSNNGEFMLNEMMHRPFVKPELVEYMRTSQRFIPSFINLVMSYEWYWLIGEAALATKFYLKKKLNIVGSVM